MTARLTVWKYPLAMETQPTVEMPVGAEILHVGEQYGRLCLWALVNTSAPVTRRRFLVAGTGHDVPASASRGRFIGTALMHDGGLVFHVWEATA